MPKPTRKPKPTFPAPADPPPSPEGDELRDAPDPDAIDDAARLADESRRNQFRIAELARQVEAAAAAGARGRKAAEEGRKRLAARRELGKRFLGRRLALGRAQEEARREDARRAAEAAAGGRERDAREIGEALRRIGEVALRIERRRNEARRGGDGDSGVEDAKVLHRLRAAAEILARVPGVRRGPMP